MDGGVEVCIEVILVLKDATASVAIPMSVAVVVVKSPLRVESLSPCSVSVTKRVTMPNTYRATGRTGVMGIVVMLLQQFFRVKKFVAKLTIEVTLSVMVLQVRPGSEVVIA
jgi:hypothetical protein